MLIRPHDAAHEDQEWRNLLTGHPFGTLIAPGVGRELPIVVAAVTYVPTSWEAPPGTAPEWGIPTSHYAAVELECTATIIDDPTEIRRCLADQLATMQPDEPYGFPLDPAAPYSAELRQIRGLELALEHVRAKFKYDGAEPDSVRRQVVAGYRLRDTPSDREALGHLLRRHPPGPTWPRPLAQRPAAPTAGGRRC